MHKSLLPFIFLNIFLSINILAQSPMYNYNTRAHKIIDRWDVLYWHSFENSLLHLGEIDREKVVKLSTSIALNRNMDVEYIQKDNIEYYSKLVQKSFSTNKLFDEDSIAYYIQSNSKDFSSPERKGLFGVFYKSPASFYKIVREDFSIIINPILDLRYGKAKDDNNEIFRNLRGLELRGTIDNTFYFYTNVLENQARFNNFIEDRISKYHAIPGQGFYKTYSSSILEQFQGWDFLNSQAYIGASLSKSISIEFGHGSHFVGSGFRSLLLSNYANNYFYLKFNTQFWKIRYQNLFAELAPISGKLLEGDHLLPKKYMASHYLTFALRKNIEIGLFETVIFSRQDHFEFQYLNPVILYRTVEQFLDSPDNVLIGLTAKWNLLHQFQVYSQIILDEFKLDEITNGNGWWANKVGFQIGLKYYNAMNIENLDIQLEYNSVRPYTYTHRDTLEGFPNQSVANYSHYNQPLAHPLGANFREIVAEVRYRLNSRLFMKMRYVKALKGNDLEDKNFGNNLLLPLESREMDYGNYIGQGIKTDINIFRFTITYDLFHNGHVDLNYLYRHEDAEINDFDMKTNYCGISFRLNIGNIMWDY